MMLPGFDVSAHQGSVDMGRAKLAEFAWVGIKATEGQDFTDPRFVDNFRRARAVGLSAMPYHYLRPRRGRNGAVEARHFCDVVLAAGWKAGHDLPLCADIEWTGNSSELRDDPAAAAAQLAEIRAMSGGALREYASDFCDEVRRRTKRRCVVYLSPSFAPELGNRAPRNGGHCWVAAWDAPDGRPPTPRGFARSKVLFHQTSDKGVVPGVAGPCDLNVFIGNRAQLQRWIDGRMPVVGGGTPSSPDVLSVREQQRLLRLIGWPIKVDGVRGPATKGALMDFQEGWAEGKARLVRDGVCGKRTARALRRSASRQGRCSEHFAYREFRSKDSPTCKGNDWIKTDRDLVRGLEAMRHALGDRPVAVVSGYRDEAKNACEGGATVSQHKYGNAADLVPHLTVAQVRALGVFSGIGFQRATGLVRHADVRHRGPNTTGGTVANPTIWIY